MAAKPVQSPAVSASRSAKFRLVSKRTSSVFTSAQSNAVRNQQINAAIRARSASQRVQLHSAPRPNNSNYFGMYAAMRRQQGRAQVSAQANYAKQRSSAQTMRLSRGNYARTQAIIRARNQRATTSYAFGAQVGMRSWVTQAAGGTPVSQAIASVTANARNTSAAARLAQSIRAQKANRSRLGIPRTKKGGGSPGKGRTSAPSINRSRRRTGLLTAKPVATPKAAVLRTFEGESKWITAGNNTGVENCAAVAIANHLWFHENLMMTDEQVNRLAVSGKTVPALLKYLRYNEFFENVWPEVPRSLTLAGPGDVVVYEIREGTHAALLLENRMVVSWGEEMPLKYPVTEGWHIKWRTYRRSGRH
jgi:hypothetical protein